MLVHTIRLREPWTRIAAECGGERLTRRFTAPTGIGGGARVFLAAGEIGVPALVLVNGQELGRLENRESSRWDITDALKPRNEVCFVVDRALELPAGSGRELLVRLEIETHASGD